MRIYKTEGIVIRRFNFGEADRILTVFTKKLGKIRVKAVGVRKINSRRSPHVELLNHSLFTLYRGKTISLVTDVEVLADYSGIKDNLVKVGLAYHLCELIEGLCPENQEHLLIFDLFKETLELLEKEEDIVGIIHEFEIELLTKLGFYNRIESSESFNTTTFIEQLLERKLRSKKFFFKLS